MRAFCVDDAKGNYLFALIMKSGETIGSVRIKSGNRINFYPLPGTDLRRWARKGEITQLCLAGYREQVEAAEELKRMGVKL